MIGIVDHGMGNLKSVINALNMVGIDPVICTTPKNIQNVDKLILPGVGAFKNCMANLKEKNLIEALNEFAIVKEKLILGICLGMQIMAKTSEEFGKCEGLGWFDAHVKKITPSKTFKIPNVGWHNINYKKHYLFQNVPQNTHLYFTHSYSMICSSQEDIIVTIDLDKPIVAGVAKKNIMALQFHPEKSQDSGLEMLDNFVRA